jgi:hypothetical protein
VPPSSVQSIGGYTYPSSATNQRALGCATSLALGRTRSRAPRQAATSAPPFATASRSSIPTSGKTEKKSSLCGRRSLPVDPLDHVDHIYSGGANLPFHHGLHPQWGSVAGKTACIRLRCPCDGILSKASRPCVGGVLACGRGGGSTAAMPNLLDPPPHTHTHANNPHCTLPHAGYGSKSGASKEWGCQRGVCYIPDAWGVWGDARYS